MTTTSHPGTRGRWLADRHPLSIPSHDGDHASLIEVSRQRWADPDPLERIYAWWRSVRGGGAQSQHTPWRKRVRCRFEAGAGGRRTVANGWKPLLWRRRDILQRRYANDGLPAALPNDLTERGQAVYPAV